MLPDELEVRMDLLKKRLRNVTSTLERQMWEDAYKNCLSLYDEGSTTRRYHESWLENYNTTRRTK